MQPAPLKIALVTHSLARGGAERSSALLSKMLEALGHEVHVIAIIDAIEYDYGGTLFNLGQLKNVDDSTLGRFKRLLAWRRYLKKHGIQYVIDNRTRQSWWSEWIIAKWLYPVRRSIFVVRSAHIADYFPHKYAIARRIYRQGVLVAVSDGIKEKITRTYGYANVLRIYNPVETNFGVNVAPFEPSHRYILSYGRMDDAVKNYSLLLDAYAQSGLPGLDVHLYLMGDGPDAGLLRSKADALPVADKIHFIPRRPDPAAVVAGALFTALSSRFEGFPRVLIESLQLGVPVVSVDCVSGPAEIVQHGKNGLLVPNDDASALAQAFSELATNGDLYDICSSHARASVAHLSEAAIAQAWQEILYVL